MLPMSPSLWGWTSFIITSILTCESSTPLFPCDAIKTLVGDDDDDFNNSNDKSISFSAIWTDWLKTDENKLAVIFYVWWCMESNLHLRPCLKKPFFNFYFRNIWAPFESIVELSHMNNARLARTTDATGNVLNCCLSNKKKYMD